MIRVCLIPYRRGNKWLRGTLSHIIDDIALDFLTGITFEFTKETNGSIKRAVDAQRLNHMLVNHMWRLGGL